MTCVVKISYREVEMLHEKSKEKIWIETFSKKKQKNKEIWKYRIRILYAI